MQFELEQAIAILGRTPAVFHTLLGDLSEEWVDANEGEGSWSPLSVLGHLVHGERADWIPRARLILERGETAVFEPFDRFAHLDESRPKVLADLLGEFAALRSASLATLGQWKLSTSDLQRRGRHPDFGVVTLAQLLATWVAHDLGHIAQATRVMAKQYAIEVGPWKAYLPVLTR